MAYRVSAAESGVPLTATRPTVRPGGKRVRWNRRMKADFLDVLASTCNVSRAAAAIGVDPVSVYGLRRRDPAFLAEWALALQAGYEMLETLAVGHVLDGGGRKEPMTVPAPSAPIDLEAALRLLTLHRGMATGRARNGGLLRQRAAEAGTDAAILKKLAALEKRREQA